MAVDREAMFRALPEVAHLIERVPCATRVITPDEIVLRYLQHCRDAGVSLKKQCRNFGIPWHARKVTAAALNHDTLPCAEKLPASVFTQCMPADAKLARKWFTAIRYAPLAGQDLNWFARHAWFFLKLQPNPEMCVHPTVAYINEYRYRLSKDTKPETVLKTVQARREAEAAERAAAIQRAHEEADRLSEQVSRQLRDMPLRVPIIPAPQYTPIDHEVAMEHLAANGPGHIEWVSNNTTALPNWSARTKIGYSKERLERYMHGPLGIRLLDSMVDFENAGNLMDNCLFTHGWFHKVQARGFHIVLVTSSTGGGVATAKISQDWTMIDKVLGRHNQKLDSRGNTSVWQGLANFMQHQRGIS